jgi:hypothetical protein
MRKIVRNTIVKMAIVYFALLFLSIWQNHFVISGFLANPYLNGTIGIAFTFATMIAFRSVLKIRGEGTALQALQNIFDTMRIEGSGQPDDSFKKFFQALEPGIVYERPHLLGHVFDLTVEEMLRTKRLRISVETMANLVQAVHSKIAQERSLLQYITGLLVFLGLIGTFIGLMEMVGSVGGIIGGLANADTGGSTEAFKKLLHDLEAPLVGMATGFSASLFGLFGSLVLGLVGRFVGASSHCVLEEFESWLASISHIENHNEDEALAIERPGVAGVAPLGRILALFVHAFQRSQSSLERSCRLLSDVINAQGQNRQLHSNTLDTLQDLCRQQASLNAQIGEALSGRELLLGTLANMQGLKSVIQTEFSDSRRDLGTIQKLVQEVKVGQSDQSTEIGHLVTSVQQDIPRQIGEVSQVVSNSGDGLRHELDRLHHTQMQQLNAILTRSNAIRQSSLAIGQEMASKSDINGLADALEKKLGTQLASASKSLDETALAVTAAANQMTPNNAQMVEMLAAIINRKSEPVRFEQVVEAIRDSFRLGLADFTRVFEEATNALPLTLQALMNSDERSLLAEPRPTAEQSGADNSVDTNRMVEQLRMAASAMVKQQTKTAS